MGSIGSDIAVEAANIAPMSCDLSKIPYLKCLSNAAAKTIKFSITLSVCINLAAIVLSLMGDPELHHRRSCTQRRVMLRRAHRLAAVQPQIRVPRGLFGL